MCKKHSKWCLAELHPKPSQSTDTLATPVVPSGCFVCISAVVGAVMNSGQPQRVDEDIATEQAQINRAVDEQLDFQTRSLVLHLLALFSAVRLVVACMSHLILLVKSLLLLGYIYNIIDLLERLMVTFIPELYTLL